MPMLQIQQAPTPYLLEVEVLAVASLEAEVAAVSAPSRETCLKMKKHVIIEDRKRSYLCILLKF